MTELKATLLDIITHIDEDIKEEENRADQKYTQSDRKYYLGKADMGRFIIGKIRKQIDELEPETK